MVWNPNGFLSPDRGGLTEHPLLTWGREWCVSSRCPRTTRGWVEQIKISMNQHITIQFDGGCKPTNPGNKYGSYEVLLNGLSVFKASRVEFGWGTNNEAEFDSLIAALNFTVENLLNGGFDTREYDVSLFTDSTIVRNRLNGSKVKSKGEAGIRMLELAHKCLLRLYQFKSYSIEWQPREHNVKRFGH